MINLIEWIKNWIDFPAQYDFILYILASVILLVLLVITLDFFASIFFAIFRRR